MTHPDEPVKVHVTSDQWEAHAIKQALEAESITCFIEGENTSATYRWAPGAMRLFVRSRDRERATEIISRNDWPRMR